MDNSSKKDRSLLDQRRQRYFHNIVVWQLVLFTIYLILHLIIDLDHVVLGNGARFSLTAGTLISADAQKALSIALFTASVSLFVLAPLLITQSRYRQENRQLTSIEKKFISSNDLIRWIGLSAVLALLVSIFTLVRPNYVGIAIQIVFILTTSILVIWEVWALSYDLDISKGEFIKRVTGWFTDQISALIRQEERDKNLSDELRRQVRSLAGDYESMEVKVIDYPSTKPSIFLERISGKRISRIGIKPTLDYLSDFLNQPKEVPNGLAEAKRVEVNIIDPHKYRVHGASTLPMISIVDIPSAITREQREELVEKMQEKLNSCTEWEDDQLESFAEDLDLIREDLSNSLFEGDHQRIKRQFQIVEEIVKSLYSHDDHSISQTKQKVYWLLREYSAPIYDTADSYLVKRSVRRIVLEHIRSLISISTTRGDVQTFSMLSGLYRAIIFDYSDSESAEGQLSSASRAQTIEHFALFIHEFSFRYKDIIYNSDNFGIAYINEQRKLFERALVWWVRRKGSKDTVVRLLDLPQRLYGHTNRPDSEVRLAILLQASCEAYFLYRVFRKDDLHKLKEVVSDIFKSELRSNSAIFLNDAITSDLIEKFSWVDWRLEDVGFGGGFRFSSTNWMLRVIAIRLMLHGDQGWIAPLNVHRLTRIKNILESDTEIWEELTSKSNVRLSREQAIRAINSQMEKKTTEENKRLSAIELDRDSLETFVQQVIDELIKSKYSKVFTDLVTTKSEKDVGKKVFTVTLPKSMFIDGPEQDTADIRMANDIWGSLIAAMLTFAHRSGCVDAVENVDDIKIRPSTFIVLENRTYPSKEEGVSRIVNLLAGEGASVLKFGVWLTSLDSGIYIIDREKIRVSVGQPLDDGSSLMQVKVLPWIKLLVQECGIEVKLEFFMEAEFLFEDDAIQLMNIAAD